MKYVILEAETERKEISRADLDKIQTIGKNGKKFTELDAVVYVDRDGVKHNLYPKEILEYIDSAIEVITDIGGPIISKFINALSPLCYTFQIPTMATDGSHIYINPAFVKNLVEKTDTVRPVAFVILHEIFHNLHDHINDEKLDTTRSSNHKLCNIAQDYEINYVIEHCMSEVDIEKGSDTEGDNLYIFDGATDEAEGYIDDRFGGKQWQEIFDILKEEGVSVPPDGPEGGEPQELSDDFKKGYADGYIDGKRDKKNGTTRNIPEPTDDYSEGYKMGYTAAMHTDTQLPQPPGGDGSGISIRTNEKNKNQNNGQSQNSQKPSDVIDINLPDDLLDDEDDENDEDTTDNGNEPGEPGLNGEDSDSTDVNVNDSDSGEGEGDESDSDASEIGGVSNQHPNSSNKSNVPNKNQQNSTNTNSSDSNVDDEDVYDNEEMYKAVDSMIATADGGYDGSDDMNTGEHIISKKEGDEIASETGVANDPRWGSQEAAWADLTDVLQGLDKILKNSNEEKINAGNGIGNTIEGKIRQNRHAFVDWKTELKDFMDDRDPQIVGYNKKQFLNGQYDFIREVKKKGLNKIVVYADTSGSVIGTPGMLQQIVTEVSNMAVECDFELLDVNLFHSTVYASHKDIDPDSTADKNWGFTDVQDGGTSLHACYDHFKKNYIDNDEDFSVVVFITDGYADSWDSYSDKNSVEEWIDKSFWVIFSSFDGLNEDQKECVPPGATVLPIMKNDFLKSLNESKTYKMKNIKSINEGFKKINVRKEDDIRLPEPEAAPKPRLAADSEERRKERMRVSMIAAKLAGNLADYTEEINDWMSVFHPKLRYVKTENEMALSDNTYTISMTEGLEFRINVHCSDFVITEAESKFLKEYIVFNTVQGNLTYKHVFMPAWGKLYNADRDVDKDRMFKIFGSRITSTSVSDIPAGFPNIVTGNFKIIGLKNLSNIDFAPLKVKGEIEIMDTNLKYADISAYEKRLKDEKIIITDCMDSIKYKNKNALIESRVMKGLNYLGYLNEAFGGRELNPNFDPSHTERGEKKWIPNKLDAIADKNKELFRELFWNKNDKALDPRYSEIEKYKNLLPIQWDKITNRDITKMNRTTTISFLNSSDSQKAKSAKGAVMYVNGNDEIFALSGLSPKIKDILWYNSEKITKKLLKERLNILVKSRDVFNTCNVDVAKLVQGENGENYDESGAATLQKDFALLTYAFLCQLYNVIPAPLLRGNDADIKDEFNMSSPRLKIISDVPFISGKKPAVVTNIRAAINVPKWFKPERSYSLPRANKMEKRLSDIKKVFEQVFSDMKLPCDYVILKGNKNKIEGVKTPSGTIKFNGYPADRDVFINFTKNVDFTYIINNELYKAFFSLLNVRIADDKPLFNPNETNATKIKKFYDSVKDVELKNTLLYSYTKLANAINSANNDKKDYDELLALVGGDESLVDKSEIWKVGNWNILLCYPDMISYGYSIDVVDGMNVKYDMNVVKIKRAERIENRFGTIARNVEMNDPKFKKDNIVTPDDIIKKNLNPASVEMEGVKSMMKSGSRLDNLNNMVILKLKNYQTQDQALKSKIDNKIIPIISGKPSSRKPESLFNLLENMSAQYFYHRDHIINVLKRNNNITDEDYISAINDAIDKIDSLYEFNDVFDKFRRSIASANVLLTKKTFSDSDAQTLLETCTDIKGRIVNGLKLKTAKLADAAVKKLNSTVGAVKK